MTQMWVLSAVLVALVTRAGSVVSSVDSVVVGAAMRMAPLVLEEVLEHGPLFDELEEEAWWAGVDIDDTALRLTPPTSPEDDHAADSCVWHDADGVACGTGAEMRPWAAPPPPPPVPPALTEMVRQIQERLGATGDEEDQCLLCQWAALNITVDMAPSAGNSPHFIYSITISQVVQRRVIKVKTENLK